jgi:DNA-binding response OmpR family regulator
MFAGVRTILIIDDNEDLGTMLRMALEGHGFKVLLAQDPLEGINVATNRRVDAVLTDYDMPVANGLSVCRAIREHNALTGQRVPVWMMTGVASFTLEALEAGAEGLLHKPFRISEVIKKLLSAFTPVALRAQAAGGPAPLRHVQPGF